MTDDNYGQFLEYWVRAFSGGDPQDTFTEGLIVGYCPAPTYQIRRPDGSRVTWRCDLTEILSEEPVPIQNQPPAKSHAAHFILYKDHIPGTAIIEAVCACGAHFRTSTNPIYGSIGEIYANHLRQIRAREEKDRYVQGQ